MKRKSNIWLKNLCEIKREPLRTDFRLSLKLFSFKLVYKFLFISNVCLSHFSLKFKIENNVYRKQNIT